MLRRLLFSCVAALAAIVAPARAVELRVQEFTLANGLKLLVHEEHSAPVISSYVFYKCGSRNEQYGQTGIAHLFEHMMFNGGRKYGPGVFDDRIEASGGSTNGFTTRDLTAYLNNFPTEALPVVLDLEADRMGHLAITKQNLEQERGIVSEERRLRVDNDVQGAMDETLYLQAFVQSPYRWNTVGFMADIQRITLEQAKAYFHACYAPNNAVVVLAGDVRAKEALRLVQRLFGEIPAHEPPPPPQADEPPQDGERRAVVRRIAELPAIFVGWHGPRAADPERAVMDVVAQLLAGGESSRLQRDLVRTAEVATTVQANMEWGSAPELFTLYAQARPGKTAAQVEARVDAVLHELATTPVGADELAKAKQQLRADAVKGLKTVGGRASKLGFTEIVLGDYHALFRLEEAWDAVTAADVQRAVATRLVPAQRTVVTLEPLPKPGGKAS